MLKFCTSNRKWHFNFYLKKIHSKFTQINFKTKFKTKQSIFYKASVVQLDSTQADFGKIMQKLASNLLCAKMSTDTQKHDNTHKTRFSLINLMIWVSPDDQNYVERIWETEHLFPPHHWSFPLPFRSIQYGCQKTKLSNTGFKALCVWLSFHVMHQLSTFHCR